MTFGLPFLGGWAEQPEYVLQIIECFVHAVNLSREQQAGPVDKSMFKGNK
jgi:hypothetical protein